MTPPRNSRISKIAALQAENQRLRQMLAELKHEAGATCTCGHSTSQHCSSDGPCNVVFCMCCKFTPDRQ